MESFARFRGLKADGESLLFFFDVWDQSNKRLHLEGVEP